MRVSPHTAQASQKATLVGRPGCVNSYAVDNAQYSRADLPSITAFAIRTCSLLTRRLAYCQSMAFHFFASSMSAPALMAVFCFPIFKGSACSLAMRHQLDVGTLCAGADAHRLLRRAMFHALSVGFPNGLCFFQPLPPAAPTARLTVMPALRCIGRRNRVNTLYIIDPMSDLGAPWTPADTIVPCKHVRDLQPDRMLLTQGSNLRPVKPQ